MPIEVIGLCFELGDLGRVMFYKNQVMEMRDKLRNKQLEHAREMISLRNQLRALDPVLSRIDNVYSKHQEAVEEEHNVVMYDQLKDFEPETQELMVTLIDERVRLIVEKVVADVLRGEGAPPPQFTGSAPATGRACDRS